MHDPPQIPPAWCVPHHHDPVPARQDVLRDGEFRAAAVQLPTLVEQFMCRVQRIDENPFA